MVVKSNSAIVLVSPGPSLPPKRITFVPPPIMVLPTTGGTVVDCKTQAPLTSVKVWPRISSYNTTPEAALAILKLLNTGAGMDEVTVQFCA